MSSPEDKAYEIMRELDVNYVLVIFGGLTGYASDGNTPALNLLCVLIVMYVYVTKCMDDIPYI